MKVDEMRGRCEFEEQKLKNNMTAENAKQTRVHDYLHQTITGLTVSTNTMNSKGMSLNRRIEELEKLIGVKACVDESGKLIY